MTLDQFKQLGNQQAIKAITDEGVLLAVRSEEDGNFYLIQLNSFYIEIFIDYTKKFTSLWCFSSVDLLEPYLASIVVDRTVNAEKTF